MLSLRLKYRNFTTFVLSLKSSGVRTEEQALGVDPEVSHSYFSLHSN